MQTHLGPALSPHIPKSDENLLLAEVEAIVGGDASELGRDRDGLAVGGARPGRRRYMLVAMSALALAAVLVPAGFKTGDLLARAAHLAAN